jgi:hypothetical protein
MLQPNSQRPCRQHSHPLSRPQLRRCSRRRSPHLSQRPLRPPSHPLSRPSLRRRSPRCSRHLTLQTNLLGSPLCSRHESQHCSPVMLQPNSQRTRRQHSHPLSRPQLRRCSRRRSPHLTLLTSLLGSPLFSRRESQQHNPVISRLGSQRTRHQHSHQLAPVLSHQDCLAVSRRHNHQRNRVLNRHLRLLFSPSVGLRRCPVCSPRTSRLRSPRRPHPYRQASPQVSLARSPRSSPTQCLLAIPVLHRPVLREPTLTSQATPTKAKMVLMTLVSTNAFPASLGFSQTNLKCRSAWRAL